MNAWSRELSLELGARGIRVNLVFPGPIESERIRSVFSTMDTMRGDEPGTTADLFFGMMSLERSTNGNAKAKTYPTPADIAKICVFLGSDDSAALNGHDFEVTHGMTVRKEERSVYLSRPTSRSMDGEGLAVLIAAGDGWQEALEIAKIQAASGARVLLGLTRQADVAIAQARAQAERLDDRLTIVRFNRTEPGAMEAALDAYTQEHSAINGAIFMPVLGPGELVGKLVDASDEDIATFMDVELAGSIALARTLSRYWKRNDNLLQEPRFVFLTNPSDGQGNVYAQMLRAATEQLIRI